MSDTVYLVPGRECGTCTACCTDLAITEDGLDKLPGVACVHCDTGSGCAIYATRPTVCRSYECLWRSLRTVDESWRPDRSGILMVLSDVPAGYRATFGVDLILVGGPDAVLGDAFAGLVGGFIESGTATHLNISPGPGFLAWRAFLNDQLAPAIAARDLAQVKAIIAGIYRTLLAQPPVAATAEDIRLAQSTSGWTPPTPSAPH